MVNSPKLTVITPSYNQAEYIEENIQSIKSQRTRISVEHIVIDGGSDDGTVKILRDYENEYDLRWVSEPDRGQTHAINKGIKMAQGDWIGWQNSDDYYLPGAFRALESSFNAPKRVDLVFGDLMITDEKGRKKSVRYHSHPSKLIQRYLSHWTANQSTFIRSSLADDVFPLDEAYDLSMDVEFFWKILEKYTDYYYAGIIIGAIREHDNSKTTQNRQQQLVQESKIEQQFYSEGIIERALPEQFMTGVAFLNRFMHLLSSGRLEDAISTIRNTIRRISGQCSDKTDSNILE